jgi:serine/threonine protein kinase/dipeptidyl aminopeptidase/acylaminoacyl peptidase
MPLTSGIKLGPYEVVAPLGAGGMGEVYRARDTRLGRDVAIKVLPSHLALDPTLKARFDREARAISSLNHPNICTLHDVGTQDGVDFLVMEYLEGETLQQRLLHGALPLKQVFEYGIRIAEALDRAHQAGIAHRDLKPGNIMLTKSGAKLLDFGLAKPVAALVARVGATGSLTPSTPTLTVASMTSQPGPLTEQGRIVGTFQYLAPEVLQGKEADARSDLFALGAVLFEMISGQPAFTGKSQLSVMTAILEKEPEPLPQVSAPLEHVVHTCLAKDPAERWQSAHEVARELRWLEESGMQPAGPALKAGTWRSWRVSTGIGVLAIALAIVATYYAVRPMPKSRLVASLLPPVDVFPDNAGRNGPPQISPDGNRLAFVGCKTSVASSSLTGGELCSIWTRSLHSTDAHEVAGTSGGYFPFWSPDGSDIAFFAEGKLKRVAADGGAVQVLADAADARGGSWNSSGAIIFAPLRSSPIFRVPADGGSPVAVTRSAPASSLADVGSHRWPYFLPDGEHFLYVHSPNGACGDMTELRFASLDGKQDSSMMRTCSSAAFADGRMIFWRDGNLMAQPFDPRRGELSGTAVAIAQHVAFDSLFSFGEFSASAESKLVYVAGEGPMGAQLVWFDRTGKLLGPVGENEQYVSVSISPDGSRVVSNTNPVDKQRILLLESRGPRTLVSLGSKVGGFPVWSADGKRIYFNSNPNGPFDIFVKDVDGSGSEQPLITFQKGQFGAVFLAASPDGKYLAYTTVDPTTKMDVYTVELTGDHRPKPFLQSPANESAPAFSPNGKWLAYESDQSGRGEIYVTAFPQGGTQYQVSTNGGERPVWRRDGKEIFYRENFKLMAVTVKPFAHGIELGTPGALFEVAVRNLSGRWYDISPDNRFLMNTSPASAHPQSFELVVDWPAAVNK